MSELDKFRRDKLNSNSLVELNSGLPVNSTHKINIKDVSSLLSSVDLSLTSKPRFAICLDSTGSMQSLINLANRSIREIITRLYAEAGKSIEIQIILYRDYDMETKDALVEASDISGDPDKLMSFLSLAKVEGGGNNDGEAVHEALKIAYSIENLKAVLLAGDEPPLNRQQLNEIGRGSTLTAIEWASKFHALKIPVHTFVLGQYERTVSEFKQVAYRSGGQTGQMDGGSEMIDMAVMAMLAALQGSSSVKTYMAKHQISTNSKRFAQALLEGPKG